MSPLMVRKLITRLVYPAALLMLAGTPVIAHAQTAAFYGSINNFDVSNETGQTACGYEIEIPGIDAAALVNTFNSQRYGAPTVETTTTGIRVRWKSSIDSSTHQCSQVTVAHPQGAAFAGTCYQWNGAAYNNSGCEHFGIYLNANPTGPVISRWLAQDTTNPTQLVGINPPAPVPFPIYVIPTSAPNLEVQVVAPEPAEAPELYGDAQWMRVFVVQVPREVSLDELLSDNKLVPQNLAQLESDWQIIQDEPASNGKGTRRQRNNIGKLDPTTKTVVRRIELYQFTGRYDPITHEALCADTLCNAPSANEIGTMVSAQMTGAAIRQNTINILKTGKGSVDSLDKQIACGNKCIAAYNLQQQVVLTAKAASGYQFAGWTGGCTGTQTSCTLTAREGQTNVTANFTVKRSGGGTGGGGTGGGGTGGGGTGGGGTGGGGSVGGKGKVK